ncbi:hypothetical protein RA265_29095, partial [Pseudomonas syringae pv. tagetis]|uniref:hypothetical protein n=1 Tax=Pseudomonas syringae group genomosp. 7 TaxID=251699 RepID=UPI0037706B96
PLDLGQLPARAGECLRIRNDVHPTRNDPQLLAPAPHFALVTAKVMRAAQHSADVPWSTEALLESMRVQAGVSKVCTLNAQA